MNQAFDIQVDRLLADEFDRLERGVHGYFPLRPVCGSCGARTCRCGRPTTSSLSYDAADPDDVFANTEAGGFAEHDEDALSALVDFAEELGEDHMEEIDAAIPRLARLAARALARPAQRRGGQIIPPVRRELIRAASRATRGLVRRQGPTGVRALPRIVRSLRRNAVRYRVDPRALPRALGRTAARVAARPRLLKRLAQPAQLAADLTRQQTAAARRVLGKRLDELPLLQRLWQETADPNAPRLTQENSRRLFNLHRRRFWREVRQHPQARRLIEAAGFYFPECRRPPCASAPIHRDVAGRAGRISLDHIARRQNAPSRALDPRNLRLVVHGDNTLLENLQQAIPALRARHHQDIPLRDVLRQLRRRGA